MTFDPLATSGVLASAPGRANRAHALVPSRLRILEALAAHASAGRGWALLTGEAGTGKSLLLEELSRRLPAGWDAIHLEISPETVPLNVFEALSDALGHRLDPTSDPLRQVRGALARSAADSRHLALHVDEGQNSTDLVLETLRLLAGRIGQDDGLASLIVSGQTPLLGRLGTARHHAIRNRLTAHFHLQGLDLDESASLLRIANPGWNVSAGELEDQHRRLLGNPRLLVRLANSAPVSTSAIPAPTLVQRAPAEPESLTKAEPLVVPELPAVRRPPLRFEEGLIEVGFPDLEADPEEPETSEVVRFEPAENAENLGVFGPAVVPDPYAEIQSRQEWEQLRGRITVPTRAPVAANLELEPQMAGKGTRIRAETPHEPRPHSRLFSRMENGPQADDEAL